MKFDRDVVVVGGCGRAGLPLGLSFADAGLRVGLYDIDEAAVATVASGTMPFKEEGGRDLLDRVRAEGRLTVTTDRTIVGTAEHVVVVVGTDVDEHLNPDPSSILAVIDELAPHLCDGQLLVLRSTVYPGMTRLVEERVADLGRAIDVAFCPERIAEGRALEELRVLPEIVSARNEEAGARAEKLFLHLTPDIQRLLPEEAELAKLFSNTWRYIKFATANQLFMIANDFGLDYERIRNAMSYRYPRAADLPPAGFTAGPCLYKDTLQLAAFNNNNFPLGQASVTINEGLPLYLVARLAKRYDLRSMTVGLLGMAFKAESDDTRASLSYKLKKILAIRAGNVLCTDPYVRSDPDLAPLDEVLARADLLIVCAPHRVYATLRTSTPVVDLWGIVPGGSSVV